MKAIVQLALIATYFFIVAFTPLSAASQQHDYLSIKSMTPAEFKVLFDRLSNKGRWGANDQLGTLNLITERSRAEAASLVKSGKTVSLERAVTYLPEFPYSKIEFDSWPQVGTQGEQGDSYKFYYHGSAHTHLDALAHMVYESRMYNNHVPHGTPSPTLGIEQMKSGIVTRGILVDIPRLRNEPYLEPGTIIPCSDIDAWLHKAKLKVRPGDALFIRTGRWAYRAQVGPGAAPDLNYSGLDLSCVEWMKQHGVSVLGSDFANEVSNSEVRKNWVVRVPFHHLAIGALGLPLIDNCDLEALSEEANKEKRWEFYLVVSPLVVPGATGSAVNPIAIF